MFYQPPAPKPHPLPPRPPVSTRPSNRTETYLSPCPSTPSHLPSRPSSPYPFHKHVIPTQSTNQDPQTTSPPSGGRKMEDDATVGSRPNLEDYRQCENTSKAQTGGGYDNKAEGETETVCGT